VYFKYKIKQRPEHIFRLSACTLFYFMDYLQNWSIEWILPQISKNNYAIISHKRKAMFYVTVELIRSGHSKNNSQRLTGETI